MHYANPKFATTTPPKYTLKKRRDTTALYRNRRIVGIDVVLVSTANGRVMIEYTPATRTGEARVSHNMPATIIDLQAMSAA